MKPAPLRSEGRVIEALLLFLKQLTAHARWVFAALLFLYAVSGVHTIQPQESALVRRLGRLERRLHGAGLLICLPHPFDQVLRFDTGKDASLQLNRWALIGSKIDDPDKPLSLTPEELERRVNSRETKGAEYAVIEDATLDPVRHGYSLTSDINVIQGRFTLRYRIDDPFHYVSAAEDPVPLLERMGYRSLSALLASRPIDASLTEGRRDLAAAAAQRIQEDATRLKLGVRITGLDILDLSPPAQVIAAFEDVTNARQFAKTMFENSRQYAAETLSKSEGEAAAIVHRAESYSQGLVETARGESSSFLALMENYRRQPQLVASRLLRESLDSAMTQVNSTTLLPVHQAQPTVILEPSPEFLR